MTPARKAALQWFHDRGEVTMFDISAPSPAIRAKMLKKDQVQKRSQGNMRFVAFSLTDKGRRDLQEATR